ncbi:MAG: serine/threonine protein kinase [Holophagales bacterium]|jgi:serine/threonine protein kinase|nr:serine/threonine protein kinase [Holophagales bacterium]
MNYSEDTPLQPSVRLTELLRDRFVFLSMLGRGGSGTVYEVRNLQLDRLEALKVLTNFLSSEMAWRFAKEAKISASLDHPGIVKVYDFGQLEGAYWYSMQLIEGPSLSTIIESGIKLNAEDMSSLAIPLLDALAYSHKCGVVHRDIKPANILLHMNGYPCLMDFGIAKSISKSMETTEYTRIGSMMGTPAYMAPEQAEGKTVDGRADQYSLAITLYRAVTGRLPFSSVGPVETLIQRLKEDPEPIDWHCPDFPASMRDVLMKALSKNRDDRFATVGEMRNAMQYACEVCNIQWNKPLEGFEHLSITRKPIDENGNTVTIDETMRTALSYVARGNTSLKERPLLMAFVGILALIVVAATIYSLDGFKGSDTTIPDTDPFVESNLDVSQSVTAPKLDTKPTVNQQSVPAKPTPTPTPTPTDTAIHPRVSRIALFTGKFSEHLEVPPELAGRTYRARVKVDVHGRVLECSIMDKDKHLTSEEKKFVTAFGMKMLFEPARTADDEPVASELGIWIQL